MEPQSIHWVRADVLKEMARQSPDRVLALAAGLGPFERRMAEEAILKAWPVEQALAWCAKLPSVWKRSQLENSENLTYPFNPKYKHHKDLHFEKADPKIIANFKWFSVTYRNNRNSHCDSGV